MKVRVFSDGSCIPNPGKGAHASIIEFSDNTRKVITGVEQQSTSNRMELMGVISALELLPKGSEVQLFVDSQYVAKGIKERLEKWAGDGWKTSTGTAVLNFDLWKKLRSLLSFHTVEVKWVKGHSGHPQNSFCDEIARWIVKNDPEGHNLDRFVANVLDCGKVA